MNSKEGLTACAHMTTAFVPYLCAKLNKEDCPVCDAVSTGNVVRGDLRVLFAKKCVGIARNTSINLMDLRVLFARKCVSIARNTSVNGNAFMQNCHVMTVKSKLTNLAESNTPAMMPAKKEAQLKWPMSAGTETKLFVMAVNSWIMSDV